MVRKSANTPTPIASQSIDKEDRYRAQDALRTLKRAEEIRGDRGLMREVKAEAKRELKSTAKVLGGKKR